MSSLNRSLITFFLSKMQNKTYLVQLKANALMYFNIVFIALMIVLSIALIFTPKTSVNHNLAYAIIIITCLTSIINLSLMRSGRYELPSNIIVITVSVLSMAGLMNKIYNNPQSGFTSYVYLMFPVVLLAGLFCSRKFVIFVTTMFFSGITVFYFVVKKNSSFELPEIATAAFVVGLFSISMTSLLTFLVVLISDKAILRTDSLAVELKELADSLEVKVQERTADLNRALSALWGEMELAKKIQTVLLPQNPGIPGYEISGYLKPADEVGGDYYDVINVEGKDWLVIGDVSGHGVPAGLIMMMVQTSIQLVLSHDPATDPSELLSRVNKTISANIQKLNENKYMTITVLACHSEGVFNFSGLHQDIMLYRSKEKKVEIVETRGMWLGIVDDIHNMVRDDQLILDHGDVMLLYTDGTTEALKKNLIDDNRVKLEMFGNERLTQLLEKNGAGGAVEIRDSIVSSLEEYIQDDDVTLLILKRVG